MTITPILAADFTKTYQWDLVQENRKENEFTWTMEKTHPFDELIASWNGLRPEKGKWNFWISLFAKGWSPWLKYAEWAPKQQKTFKNAPQGSNFESYQDAVFPKEGFCDGFRVKVTAEEGANLETFDALYACVSNLSRYSVLQPQETLSSVFLSNVPRRSQLKLDHPRFADLCSPTATSTAMNYLLGTNKVHPIAFAENIHDQEFDIYGNWILNTAQAYQELGGKFRSRVERLNSFCHLHSYLLRGLPVVVSIRGPLIGAYRPMTFGHLVCVIGYDSEKQTVQCIDSGFPEDDETYVSYPLKDFLEAWARRQNLAYVFTPKSIISSLGTIMR